MSDSETKARKKEAKARVKLAKARAKAARAAATPARPGTRERGAFRAGLVRLVREGVFQTVVKIVAGLVVGYLLIRFGLR